MDAPSHAGGVVCRKGASGTEYLIATAKKNPDHWLLPKGHIEPGESPADAARREVREETGVDAEVVASLGVHPAGDFAVEYFLMTYAGEGEAEDQRRTLWCPFEEALRKITFEDTREIVRLAHARGDA